ncbi:MAG: glycosyltransferase [Chlamydiia bacterium]|nr:glycosyltransferase [Chlamydiia bacterium]
MKRFLFFLILLAAGFSAGFSAARWNVPELLATRLAFKERGEGSSAFTPTQYPITNLPFTILIVGRNNGAFVEKTLRSVFTQNYDPFRILYIDDASDDGSFDLVQDLVHSSVRMAQTQMVRNERSLGFLANLAGAVQGMNDDEIVVVLRGEDWFSHEWVLQKLNQYYANPDLWLTYGQYREYPSFQMGLSRPYSAQAIEKGIRELPFTASHLQTFYAGLFKRIEKADLLYKGEYLEVASPMSYMVPMLEMAGGHSQYIPDVLYIVNREVSQGVDLVQQVFFERYIRSLKPYEHLSVLSADFESHESLSIEAAE